MQRERFLFLNFSGKGSDTLNIFSFLSVLTVISALIFIVAKNKNIKMLNIKIPWLITIKFERFKK